MWRKIEADHVDGRTGHRLLRLLHLVGIEPVDGEAEHEAEFVAICTEKGKAVGTLERMYPAGIEEVLHRPWS